MFEIQFYSSCQMENRMRKEKIEFQVSLIIEHEREACE